MILDFPWQKKSLSVPKICLRLQNHAFTAKVKCSWPVFCAPFDVHQDWDTVIYSCAWFLKNSVFLEGLEEWCSALMLIDSEMKGAELSKHRCAVTGENPWRFYKTTWAFDCVSNLSQQHTAAHCDLCDPCLLKFYSAEPMMLGSFNWRQSIQYISNKRVQSAQLCRYLSCVPQKVYIGEDTARPPTSLCCSPQCFIMSCSVDVWEACCSLSSFYSEM